MRYKVWDETTYLLPNFKVCSVVVWDGISNFITQFTEHVVTHPRWHLSYPMLLKGDPAIWMRGSSMSLRWVVSSLGLVSAELINLQKYNLGIHEWILEMQNLYNWKRHTEKSNKWITHSLLNRCVDMSGEGISNRNVSSDEFVKGGYGSVDAKD